jgi:hypothetical protein
VHPVPVTHGETMDEFRDFTKGFRLFATAFAFCIALGLFYLGVGNIKIGVPLMNIATVFAFAALIWEATQRIKAWRAMQADVARQPTSAH